MQARRRAAASIRAEERSLDMDPVAAGCLSSIHAIVQAVGSDRSRLMDIALAVQHRFGEISQEAVQAIAAELGIHPVEVEDMVSFYVFLDRAPRGRNRIRLSKTPISFIKGAETVARAFEQALDLTMGATSRDGAFTVEWTNDIGMADQEPAALVNGVVLTGLTPADVPAILAALRRQGDKTEPPYPPHAGGDHGLLKSSVRPSLVHAGPLLSDPLTWPSAIEAALAMTPDQVIEVVTNSKLRGRGGAGFPTGMKWRLTRKAAGDEHYILCNADEGEPGTFKDRMLLTQFPELVFDGMTVAGYALGSCEGIIYLRGEYAYLWDSLQAALKARRELGLLGKAVNGRIGFDFDIRIQLGAGAYICGEESSLIESLEGKRGSPRDRPPFPTEHGYLQQPSAVDNVESLACAARILQMGAPWFEALGTKQSTGTKLMSVAGDCTRPGVYEIAFGTTLNDLLDLVGATDAAYVQMSGPSGQSVAPRDYGRRIAYEDLSTGGSMMVFGPQRDVLEIALQFAEFFVEESCGWCAPCRVGTVLLKQGMEKIVAGRATLADMSATEALADTVVRMSRCGLGQTAPNPILTTMRSFPELYEARLAPEPFEPIVTLQDALGEARAIRAHEPARQDA
jgi:[NiFe] hydrogenase diaphorase moiety large subunit